MTKQVFGSISQCCHVWAQQGQKTGRTGNGNVFFDGKTIYSYGLHFPIATFVKDKATGDDYVILNEDTYSVSTTNHQREVRGAVRHHTVLYTTTAILDIIVGTLNKKTLKAQLRLRTREYLEEALDTASRRIAVRRKASLIEDDIAAVTATFKQTEKLLALYKLIIPAALRRKLYDLQTDTESVTQKHKKQIAKEREYYKKREAKRKAEEARILREAAPLWREGKATFQHKYALRRDSTILLRLKDGKTIETTHGAEFPVEHGRKAWNVIKAIKHIQQPFHGEPQLRLGHFKIDSIDTGGNVTAGCHYVEFEEIERMAKQLGLI